jgi:hypothetical protein
VTETPPTHRCAIALWRGYVSAQFYARSQDGNGLLALSPTFRTWRFPWQKRQPLSKDPSALDALDALRADLESNGWKPMRRAAGSRWFEYRFRSGDSPADSTARRHRRLHRVRRS